MSKEIQIFKNDEFGQVRGILINDEPYFIGKEVAEVLGYANSKDAIQKHVDEEDKQIIQRSQFATLEIPNRGLTIINESGLYSLILSSKLPTAKKFKRWVTSEVLPQIRKTGSYQALNTSELSPELQMFNQMFKAIANQEIEQKQMKKDIEDTKEQLQGIRDVVALTPNAWRKDTASLISKIAKKLGGFEHIKDVREESYKILNESYRVDIKRRLLNKQKNMALEGCSQSKINKVNYLDVIADDEKLINGYLSVVSKMAIKHGVDMN